MSRFLRALGLLGVTWLVATVGTPSVAQADGGEIAYISNDFRSIHLVQADGTGDRQLMAGANLTTLAWSPDGKVLAYTQTAATTSPVQRIFLYDTSAGRATELKTGVQTIGSVAYFPDGKRLAAVSAPTEMGFPHCLGSQFLTIDVAAAKAVPFGPAGCALRLQVAPDGAALIASRCSGAPACYVENVSIPAADQTNITDPADGQIPISGGAAVSPDNTTVAYIARHGFGNESPTDLALADRDGSNPRVIWEGPFGTAGFAPDGRQLVVSRSQGMAAQGNANQTIWVVGIDGSDPRQIATGTQPAWRPGGAAPAVVSVAPPAAEDAPRATGDAAPNDAGQAAAPGADSQREAILAAVQRANSAWATASRTLDGSVLTGAIAGQELAADLAEISRLRGLGQTRNNVNTVFTVTDVTVDAPGHAVVRTHETWYADIIDHASGRVLQQTAPTSYDETYTVELQNDAWIVTLNELH